MRWHFNDALGKMVSDAMVKEETRERRIGRWLQGVPGNGTARRPSAPPSRFPSFTQGPTADDAANAGPPTSGSLNTGSSTANPPTTSTSPTASANAISTAAQPAASTPAAPELNPSYVSDVSRTEVDPESASVAGSHDDSRELAELQTAEARTAQRVSTGQPARAVVLDRPDGSARDGNATPERPARRAYPVPPGRRLARKLSAREVAAAGGASKLPASGAASGQAPPAAAAQQPVFAPLPGIFTGPGTPGHLVLPASPPARPPRSPNRPLGPRRMPREMTQRTPHDGAEAGPSAGSAGHKRQFSDESEGKQSKRSRSSAKN